MATDPSISEIVGRPDPELGGGAPPVVIDNREAIRNVIEAQRFRAQQKTQQYENNMARLGDVYKDLGAIQAMDTLEEDRPVLNKKAAEIFSTIGDDPASLRSGKKYAEVQRDLGELRTLATQSKQDNLFASFNEKYLSDPSYDTADNKQLASGFRKQQLGQRQHYALSVPPTFDANKAGDEIIKSKMVSDTKGENEVDPSDPKWMVSRNVTTVRREPYLKIWNAGYNANDNVKKWADAQFEKGKQNPDILGLYADPTTGELPKSGQELYNNLGKVQFGHSQDFAIKDEGKRVANPYAILSVKQAHDVYMEGLKTGDKFKLEAAKAATEGFSVPENALYLKRGVASLIQNGRPSATTKGAYEISPPDFIKAVSDYVTTTQKEGNMLDEHAMTIVNKGQPSKSEMLPNGSIQLSWDAIKKQGLDGKSTEVQPAKSETIPLRQWMVWMGGAVAQKVRAAATNRAEDDLRGKDIISTLQRINEKGDDGFDPSGMKKTLFKGKHYYISKDNKVFDEQGNQVK